MDEKADQKPIHRIKNGAWDRRGMWFNLIETHSFRKLFDKFCCLYYKMFTVVVVGGGERNFNVVIPSICTYKIH